MSFILRGNVIELAVAVIIGAAFNSVVTSFVHDFLTPLIALFGGKPNFDAIKFTLHGTTFQHGDFYKRRYLVPDHRSRCVLFRHRADE